MKLTDDKRTVELDIRGAYTAQQLESLLQKLALLRADMAPQVPHTRAQVDADVLVEDKPGLVIAQRRDGGFRLWLRHRGYGWLTYQIDDRSAAGAANFIRSKTAGVEAIDFVGNGNAHRH